MFPLFKNNENIEEGISEEFIEILKKCHNPHIICIYGDARTGKSTKLNQIINGTVSENYFDLKGPFKTLKEIHTTMTKGCNFYGPIKINDIAHKNNIDIKELDKDVLNDELFFVDTEGLKTIDHMTKSCISGILTILQIASIKILYIPFLENEKLEEAVKNTKLSNILNIFVNDSKIIVLIRDIRLNEEKNERRMDEELNHQKKIFEEKINEYFEKIDGNTNALCEILPSFDLSSRNVEPFPNCYENQMEKLVFSILMNIKNKKDLNGEKLIEIIKEFLEIFKKVKDIEIMKNTENALNSILEELFKEKAKKIYCDLYEKINLFDKNIIILNGNQNAIKNYFVECLKTELKNTWEIYNKTIPNEINKQIELYVFKLEENIKTSFEKEKEKINKECYSIINIKNNEKIMNHFSNIFYKEEIDKKKIDEIIEGIIQEFLDKNKFFFECIENIDNNYKNDLIKFINSNIYNNLSLIINSKPEWKIYLRNLMFDIEEKISNPFKNNLKKNSNKKEIQTHFNNNFDNLIKKIEIYIADKGINIYNIDEFKNEINKMIEKIKEDLNNQIKLLDAKITENELKKQKLYSRSISDGLYIIYATHCKDKVLDINGGSKENNAVLQLWEFNNSNAQKFYVEYNTQGKFYTIKCLCSDKFITYDESEKKIIQFSNNNSKNQQWHIISSINNYEIISELNGKNMDVYNVGTNSGTKITTCEKNYGLNQQFKFETTIPTPPPLPTPPPIPDPVPPVSYFPVPNFHHPYSDRNSIVDALKSIGVDSSLHYRTIIGQINGISGRPGQPSYNVQMLNLLKNGQLKRP